MNTDNLIRQMVRSIRAGKLSDAQISLSELLDKKLSEKKKNISQSVELDKGDLS